jgi:hypothetical protein
MDRRTGEALTTGIVTLPRRPVHAGLWFRLLRTLLDEVNTPTSLVRPRAYELSALSPCSPRDRVGRPDAPVRPQRGRLDQRATVDVTAAQDHQGDG